jgi:hypothetical protein
MGVDQYWIKPESDQEMGLFMESIESLLNREAQGGFRGVQSKSLVDIIQLECLSQASSVLKITNGVVEGKIWIQNGEVIHAEAPDCTAEPAFQRILSWKAGNFETMTAEPNRERTIFTSYQGLLLNTAQAFDEEASLPAEVGKGSSANVATLLAELSQLNGVEFLLAVGADQDAPQDFWGLENPKPMSEWMRETLEKFQTLGDLLQAGQLQQVVGTGPQRKVALAPCAKTELCVGFPPTFSVEQMRETMKTILTRWVS